MLLDDFQGGHQHLQRPSVVVLLYQLLRESPDAVGISRQFRLVARKRLDGLSELKLRRPWLFLKCISYATKEVEV